MTNVMLRSAEEYRREARRVRELAKNVRPENQEVLLEIAAQYEQLAEHAIFIEQFRLSTLGQRHV